MKTLFLTLSGISLMVASMGCCCGLGGGQCCSYGGGGGCPNGACGTVAPQGYPQGAMLPDGTTQAAAIQIQPASTVASTAPTYQSAMYRTTLLDPMPTF